MRGKWTDLVGQSYGSLTVLRQRGGGPKKEVDCVCDCGREVTVLSRNLLSGNTKSCGCRKDARDLTGREFWNWTVLGLHDIHGGHRRWLCRCACGTERVLFGSNLRNHTTKSCGCRPREAKPLDGWF